MKTAPLTMTDQLKLARLREERAWNKLFASLDLNQVQVRFAYDTYIACVQESERLEKALGIRRTGS